jgi:hypothetical protein
MLGGLIILFAAICLIGFAYAGVIYACVYFRTRAKFRLNAMQQIAGDIANTNSLQSTPFHEGVNTDA